ncbi:MAG: hypothetical protein LKF79_04030 [Solobacterium sp.]|nr:hypothetical protein [Solobacterium sp.]MCH4265795.1 hypothetical protein [Solobacterium sp.]
MAHRNHPKQQRPEELELTDPEHRPDYMKFIRKAESGAKTEVAVMKVKMADGDFHYARMSARAVMARSQISVFVMTILDIHDLVHKEKQLSETRMELDG